MSDAARSAPPEAGPPRAGPPWIDPGIQSRIAWRDGDVVISVPPKSGTTWTMNIVHQLLAGAPSEFRDIYEEVPWIEFLAHPGETPQDVADRVAAMPATARRAFKTHSAPPDAPFLAPGSGRDVKYVVVFRNPEEAIVSFRPFLEQHSDAWFALWGMPREALCRPDFPRFYAEVVDAHGMQGAFFGFLAAWWPLRHEPNVLFLHFSDMKRDLEGSVRRIAGFLEVEPDAQTWPRVLEHASFAWMKRHEDKFEARSAGEVRILEAGAMIRKGETGQAAAEGMTPEISRHLREVGGRICPDPQAVAWLYEGGPLP
ncbi:sulfotransferase domain-containing protein [Albimonas pacifica]|uniref:Sulfotransferase domain-containing protein n=1 Tax=Albimonas pacifica TaxID=1114924 RepID=A0A1I3JPV4_9RHOB|nr:sulfotransferase domain-containing protein [Albimonas pacifica]SFI62287.1 Sulfotransferase domain-containing protein [Albimonas pacifica]